MTNSLTRVITRPTLVSPGTPGSPGSPGSPSTPAHDVTETYTGESTASRLFVLPKGQAGTWSAFNLGGRIVSTQVWEVGSNNHFLVTYTVIATVTRTRRVEATPAIPAVPPTPGTAPVYSIGGASGWTGGARSIAQLTGDGSASFFAGGGIAGAAVGLRTSAAQSYDFGAASHGFYLSGGTFRIVEGGVVRGPSRTYTPNTRFSVERIGAAVRYYYGGALIDTSLATSVGTAYINASLYAGGDSILDAEISETVTPVLTEARGSFTPMTSRASAEAQVSTASASGTMCAMTSMAGDLAAYAGGSASLMPLSGTAQADAEPVPEITSAIGVLPMLVSAATSKTPNSVLDPHIALMVLDVSWASGQWEGATVHIVSGTGAGQSSTVAANLAQALLIGEPWAVLPDASSHFEIRQGSTILLSGTVAPPPSGLLPLTSLSSQGLYAGASGAFHPMTSLALQARSDYLLFLLKRPVRSRVLAFAHDSTGENSFIYTAKRRIVRAYTGAQLYARAKPRKLTASATVTSMIRARIVAPARVVVATATAGSVCSAVITRPNAPVVSAFTGCTVKATAGRRRVIAQASAGGVIVANLTAPRARLVATASQPGVIRARLIAPKAFLQAGCIIRLTAPRAKLIAWASADAEPAYEAYSINLTHKPRAQGQEPAVDEVTRYTNFPFTHIVRFRDSYFGAAADGLCLLEGTVDDGAPIAYAVKTCVDDFGTSEKKTIAAACFGGRLGPDTTITLTAGEASAQGYVYSTPRGALAQNHREKFGRGVKDRYFALGLAGTDTLELDQLELETLKLTRRI